MHVSGGAFSMGSGIRDTQLKEDYSGETSCTATRVMEHQHVYIVFPIDTTEPL